ncbi:MAG TPA: DMT family transporter, partial [bacterium]|nr:DMT family transporter [bacterium]
AASATWAVYTLLSRGVVEKLSPFYVSRRMFVVACIFLLPFFVHDLAAGRISHVSPLSIAAVFYLGIFCSALSYVLWNHTLKVLGMVLVSNMIYLQCVYAMLAASVTIHEPITPMLIGFTAILLAGVFLANKGVGASDGGGD